MRSFFALPLVALVACRVRVDQVTYASFDEAVASVVSDSSDWHIGKNGDCLNHFLKDMLAEDSSYQAYRARGDFTGDGREDQAFAVVKGDSGTIYWVESRTGGFGAPVLLTRLDWITDGGLVVRDGRLLFGKFYSDVVWIWRWNPNTRGLEVVPEPSET